MDGYFPVFSDFETAEQPFSLIYQDMCFDSLQLTFYSLFGDSVTVSERNVSKGKICINPRKLDRLAGYERGRIPTKHGGNKEIYISYESIGCFLSSEETLKWSSKAPLQLEYGQRYGEETSLTSIDSFPRKALAAIQSAQKIRLSPGNANIDIVRIKVGPYIHELNDMTNDLSSIRKLFSEVTGRPLSR